MWRAGNRAGGEELGWASFVLTATPKKEAMYLYNLQHRVTHMR